jgi:serine/threonine protein kinase
VLLFSELKIGPKVKKLCGFDLIVHEDCLEFSTEICEKQNIDQEGASDLKESLQTMHMLKFIHRDIKPANIIYSKTFKKHVFIDFGSSSCLK